MIGLPDFKPKKTPKLSQALLTERGGESSLSEKITLDSFSRMLFALQGCTAKKWGTCLRTVPSAGATYPLELHVAVNEVEGIEPGLYKYVSDQSFKHLLERETGVHDAKACFRVLVECAPSRTTSVYGTRGYRYINEEVGHLLQNAYVESAVLGLSFSFRVEPAKPGIVAELDFRPAAGVSMPEPLRPDEKGAEEALAERRSIRRYAHRRISRQEFEYLLTCICGDEARPFVGVGSRMVDVIVVVRDVEGFSPGVYIYERGRLERISGGDVSGSLAAAALGQHQVRAAQLNLVFAGDGWECEVLAGVLGQNVYLAATALGLGTVAIGAFYDDEVAELLGLEERPLYIFPVGSL